MNTFAVREEIYVSAFLLDEVEKDVHAQVQYRVAYLRTERYFLSGVASYLNVV